MRCAARRTQCVSLLTRVSRSFDCVVVVGTRAARVKTETEEAAVGKTDAPESEETKNEESKETEEERELRELRATRKQMLDFELVLNPAVRDVGSGTLVRRG